MTSHPQARSGSAVTLHRALQEFQRSSTIPALRREDLKHFAFVIHRSPAYLWARYRAWKGLTEEAEQFVL